MEFTDWQRLWVGIFMVSCARKVRSPLHLYTGSTTVEIVLSDMNFLCLRVLLSLAVFFSLGLNLCNPNLPFLLYFTCRCSIDGSGLQFCSRSFFSCLPLMFFYRHPMFLFHCTNSGWVFLALSNRAKFTSPSHSFVASNISLRYFPT